MTKPNKRTGGKKKCEHLNVVLKCNDCENGKWSNPVRAMAFLETLLTRLYSENKPKPPITKPEEKADELNIPLCDGKHPRLGCERDRKMNKTIQQLHQMLSESTVDGTTDYELFAEKVISLLNKGKVKPNKGKKAKCHWWDGDILHKIYPCPHHPMGATKPNLELIDINLHNKLVQEVVNYGLLDMRNFHNATVTVNRILMILISNWVKPFEPNLRTILGFKTGSTKLPKAKTTSTVKGKFKYKIE